MEYLRDEYEPVNYAKILVMDLETWNLIPPKPEENIHQDISDCGISAASITKVVDGKVTETTNVYPSNHKRWSVNYATKFLGRLEDYQKDGWTIATHNGAGFDFKLLAEVTKLKQICKDMSLKSLDTLYWIYSQVGYPVSLDNFVNGMQLPIKKVKKTTLSDGRVVHMSGALFVDYWKAGEIEACIPYLEADTIALAHAIIKWVNVGAIRWLSKQGKGKILERRPMLVEECLNQEIPKGYWFNNFFPNKYDFIDWSIK